MSCLQVIAGRVLRWFVTPRRGDHTSSIYEGFRSIGCGVEIRDSVQIDPKSRVSIGNYVYIGPRTQLFGRGGLEIQDHVIVGPEVVVLTSMHNYRNATMVPYDEIELLRPVTIERCVWIGMRALILPGVTVGEGSVVGAGAVVTKSCPPGSVMAGNPAQQVGQRDMDHYWSCVDDGRFYLMQKARDGLLKREVEDLSKT